jgi:hypothetical protein
MTPEQIIARMRDARAEWIDLAPGKRLQLLRPTELDVVRHLLKTGADGKRNFSCEFEDVVRAACGWEGFTEADLVGAAVGNSDPLAFHPGLWGAVVADKLDWLQLAAQKILDMVVAHQAAQAEDEKN